MIGDSRTVKVKRSSGLAQRLGEIENSGVSDKIVIERCIDCQGTKANACVMWRALPVPYFGNVDGNKLRAATVGLNPAATEFVDERVDWRNATERLPVVMDYEAETRTELNEAMARHAALERVVYFGRRGGAKHPWFEQLEGVMRAVRHGWSYEAGTAVHVDLVACATWQPWGDLDEAAQRVMLEKCFPNFCATLKRLHYEVWLLLDGRTVSEMVLERCEPETVTKEKLAGVTALEVWSGKLSGRYGQHRFLGWSNPVNRQRNQQALVAWMRRQAR